MKYKLTKNTKEWLGKTLYQIEAIASFGMVVKGELGGYIEKEGNLSQEGNAWVYDNARVSGNALVSGDIRLSSGYFFGTRYKKEEIKFHKLDENNELIYMIGFSGASRHRETAATDSSPHTAVNSVTENSRKILLGLTFTFYDHQEKKAPHNIEESNRLGLD